MLNLAGEAYGTPLRLGEPRFAAWGLWGLWNYLPSFYEVSVPTKRRLRTTQVAPEKQG